MTLLVTATTGGLMDLATVSLHIASLWPRPVTVIEADPDGGRLAARHDWDVRPGLVELAAALRSHVSGDFDRASVVRTYSAQVSVVVAPPAAEPVMAALSVLATRTAEIESLVGTDVIVDVGRVRPDSPANALVTAADRRLLVTRTDLEDIVSVVHRGDHLTSSNCALLSEPTKQTHNQSPSSRYRPNNTAHTPAANKPKGTATNMQAITTQIIPATSQIRETTDRINTIQSVSEHRATRTRLLTFQRC